MTRILLAFLLVGFFWSAPAVAQQDQPLAQQFIEELGDRTIALLSDPDATEETLTGDFRQLFTDSFDTNTIGRFVLGRHWNGASDAERMEYLELFREFVVQTYADRFSEYSGEQFLVQGTRPAGSSDVIVSTRIVDPGGRPPIAVDWRTRVREGTVQIVDVTVENVSMAITYRNEFGAVIQRNGGTLEGLLQALRQRVDEMRAG